jgi:adenylylsulfate kinase
MVERGDFIEIYCDCPVEVCESRDVKGLYKKARNGQISEFTGISSPYEPPINPELTVSTAAQDVAESVKEIIGALTVAKLIGLPVKSK